MSSPPSSCMSVLSSFFSVSSSSEQPTTQLPSTFTTTTKPPLPSPPPSSAFPPDLKPPVQIPLTFSTFPPDLKPPIEIPLTKSSKILIVGGGGTMGSSTALHLARRGYTDVTILDVFPIPSAQSAGFDLNKIAGGGENTGMRGKLLEKIMDGWRNDPVFSPHYHEVGRVTGAHSSPEKIAALREVYDRGHRDGWGTTSEWLNGPEDIIRKFPQLDRADLKGWQGLYSPNSGWVEAKDTIESIGRELVRLGVKSSFGPSGTFKAPILDSTGKRCIGIETEDGTRWEADRVVMACGAWTPTLIDLQGQCVSKCWVIGHLQLTLEEQRKYKNCPVIYHDEFGFFFEPREDTGIMKLCNEMPGFTRVLDHQTPFGAPPGGVSLSVPRSHAVHPTDTMPEGTVDDIKRLIDTLIPEFSGRELIDQKMCWCTDTADAEWLFTEDPRWKGLFLATGDSGHSFHTIPYVGSEIADMLEGKLSPEKQKAWGWRPGAGDPSHTGRGGPPPTDLSEVDGWVGEDPEEEI